MLTLTEELVLLLDTENRTTVPIHEHAHRSALAGAVLMDLSFEYRIDTDLQSLVLTDKTATGNPTLDKILDKIANTSLAKDTETWIQVLSNEDSESIRRDALTGLVERGIVQKRVEHYLGVIRSVRYHLLDEGVLTDIRLRVEEVLADDIPDPRDAALFCLIDSCGIVAELVPPKLVFKSRERLARLRQLDLIGRGVGSSIADIQRRLSAEARARALRYRRLLLAVSAITCIAAAATLLVSRIPFPDNFGSSILTRLWLEGSWQEWSGYLLLGVSLLGGVIALVIKQRLVARVAASLDWRLSHVFLGLICAALLFFHTGFRLGSNVNAVLMILFVLALATGALIGVVTGGALPLRKLGIIRNNRPRRALIMLHALAMLPLPALVVIHILIVYLY